MSICVSDLSTCLSLFDFLSFDMFLWTLCSYLFHILFFCRNPQTLGGKIIGGIVFKRNRVADPDPVMLVGSGYGFLG